MSKIVLVETVSTFRHLFAVELKDNEPNEFALDHITFHISGGEDKRIEEFAQQHIAEDVFSHRVITEKEYIEIFDEKNEYLKEWSDDQKKNFICRVDVEDTTTDTAEATYLDLY